MVILKTKRVYKNPQTVISRYKFIDITPTEKRLEHKVFEKDGKKYRYNGWRMITVKGHQDVEMIEVEGV